MSRSLAVCAATAVGGAVALRAFLAVSRARGVRLEQDRTHDRKRLIIAIADEFCANDGDIAEVMRARAAPPPSRRPCARRVASGSPHWGGPWFAREGGQARRHWHCS